MRAHFQVLHEVVVAEAGAVVKTIGDAVMATFASPERAVSAALRMRKAMRPLNEQRGSEDLILKIGIHEGPCLAVVLNERQDFFGQTVTIASRVQGPATSQSILATGPVVESAQAAHLFVGNELKGVAERRELRGITDEYVIYEIPYPLRARLAAASLVREAGPGLCSDWSRATLGDVATAGDAITVWCNNRASGC